MASREYTCKLLEEMDQGKYDPAKLVEALVSYMPEAEVKDFYQIWTAECDYEDDQE